MNLRKTLFILPSLFTLSSIFCGFYATLLCLDAADGETFYRASLLIVFAMFFDLIDGRVARLTKTQSAFGVQIDSLADAISFGVAPAVLVFQWSLHSIGTAGMVVAFVYVACGAIRLARFNVLATSETGAPKKPGKYIIGLPIPAAAGGIVSVVVANHAVEGTLNGSPFVVLGIVLTLAFFMVTTIKFRSFKDLKLSVRTVVMMAIALGSSAALAVLFHPTFALVALMTCYLAMGVAETVFNISRRGRRRPREIAEDQDEVKER